MSFASKVRRFQDRFRVLTLVLPGTARVGSDVSNKLTLPKNVTFIKAIVLASTAPTGADLILDVKLAGTSLWAVTPANRPKLVAGSTGPTSYTAFDTTTGTAGQVLSFDVVQVGSTIPGRRVVLQLELTF